VLEIDDMLLNLDISNANNGGIQGILKIARQHREVVFGSYRADEDAYNALLITLSVCCKKREDSIKELSAIDLAIGKLCAWFENGGIPLHVLYDKDYFPDVSDTNSSICDSE
jgi:hypothetical protein